MKRCTKCGIDKCETEFYKAGKNYLHPQCKNCFRENKREYRKYYYSENKDKVKESSKGYYHRTKDKQRKSRYAYRREYIKYGLPKFKERIRRLVWGSITSRGWKKGTKTQQILGCSFQELYSHLQLTFLKNYGRLKTVEEQVHIDHIIPLATAQTEEDVIRLNHWTNLQWLTPEDNLKKGARLNFIPSKAS